VARDVSVDPAKVEALAAQGLTVRQIAHCLDCSRTTLYQRMGSQADVANAIKRGRAKGIGTITNALFQAGKSGNVTAQIFYLKNRQPDKYKWMDRKAVEVSGAVDHVHGMNREDIAMRLAAAGLDPEQVIKNLH